MSCASDHPTLADVLSKTVYKPGWTFGMKPDTGANGTSGCYVVVDSRSESRVTPGKMIIITHAFLVPDGAKSSADWATWLSNRFQAVENWDHDQFFGVNGLVDQQHPYDETDPHTVWHYESATL